MPGSHEGNHIGLQSVGSVSHFGWFTSKPTGQKKFKAIHII